MSQHIPGRPFIALFAVAVLCSQAGAQKGSDGAQWLGTPPAFAVIVSDPLTIHVGEDLSFQVFDTNVPGTGQVYPKGSTETGDMGLLARVDGSMFRPDFAPHPGQTGTYGYFGTGPLASATTWAYVSLGAVTGSGTRIPDDPWTLVVTADAGTTSVRMVVTVTCYDGDEFFTVSCDVQNTGALPSSVDLYLAADLHLAGSDKGTGLRDPFTGAVGARTCSDPLRAMLLVPTGGATLFSARHWNSLWPEIGNGNLQGIVDENCHDIAAALEWPALFVAPLTTVNRTSRVVIASGGSDPCKTPSGMRGWWPFDEAAPTTQWAETVYGNDGVGQGAAGLPMPVPGKVENAVHVNAGTNISYVEIADHPSYDITTTDFTIDAWVYVESLVPFGGAIFFKGTFDPAFPNEPAILFTALAAGGGIQLALSLQNATEASAHISDGTFPYLTWTHVTVTVSRSTNTVRFFIDGQEVPAIDVGGLPVPLGSLDSSLPAWVGLGGAGGVSTQLYILVGSVDELEIFHRALSQPEVESIATAGKCKDLALVPWMTTLCPPGQTTTVPVTICNDGPVDATYSWYVMPSISGGPCNAPFSPFYGLPSGGFPEVSTVQAMSCETYFVTIPSLSIAADELLCYEVFVENLANGHTTSAMGVLRPPGPFVAWKPISSGGLGSVDVGIVTPIDFLIDNTGGGLAAIDYEIVVAKPDPGVKLKKPRRPTVTWREPGSPFVGSGTLKGWDPVEQTLHDLVQLDSSILSLDGQAAGTPATGTALIPAGMMGLVSVNVLSLDHEGFAAFDLLLLADVDGDGTKEIVSTETVRTAP